MPSANRAKRADTVRTCPRCGETVRVRRRDDGTEVLLSFEPLLVFLPVKGSDIVRRAWGYEAHVYRCQAMP